MGDFAPHDKTSESVPGPSVISSSTDHWAHPCWHAFDGVLTSNDWITNGESNGGWLKIDLGSGITHVLNSYSIQVNDVPDPTRAPKAWTMQGSNDNSNWDVLDTRSNQTDWGSGEKRDFGGLAGTTAYRYFKIVITETNGDPDHVQICELYLCEAEEGATKGGSMFLVF